MKKTLIILSVILLIAAACDKKSAPPKNQQPSTPREDKQQTKKPDQTADWKTYANTQYGFEFKHPANYQIKEGKWNGRQLAYFIPPQSYLVDESLPVVDVMMPKGEFPGTDLEGALLAVYVGKNLTLIGCQQYNAKTPEEKFMTKIVNINGVEFFQAEVGGAAAGHQSSDRIYHTFYNNTCYEIVLGVRTGGSGAVEGLKQVDQKEVLQKLEQVLGIFKFVK